MGVTHPVDAVADVRRTDARSRKRDRPDGVTHGFQVIAYKVDPRVCVFARNLLSKHDCRAALLDEVVECRPQVPLVIKPSALACRAERLARTGTGPNRSVVWPSGAPKGVGPDANAREEVALRVPSNIVWVDIPNIPLVNIARRDMAGGNQIAQPLGGEWVDFVVIGSWHEASRLIRVARLFLRRARDHVVVVVLLVGQVHPRTSSKLN